MLDYLLEMDPSEQKLLLFLLFLPLLIIWGMRRRNKRTYQLKKHGFKISPNYIFAKWLEMDEFHVFYGCGNGESYFGEYGGLKMGLFTYNHYGLVTVVAVELEKPLPVFVLRPSDSDDKIKGFFGFKGITFQGYVTFSKKYHLVSSEEEKVREIFDDSVLRMFSANLGLWVESNGKKLVIFHQKEDLGFNVHLERLLQRAAQIHSVLTK